MKWENFCLELVFCDGNKMEIDLRCRWLISQQSSYNIVMCFVCRWEDCLFLIFTLHIWFAVYKNKGGNEIITKFLINFFC